MGNMAVGTPLSTHPRVFYRSSQSSLYDVSLTWPGTGGWAEFNARRAGGSNSGVARLMAQQIEGTIDATHPFPGRDGILCLTDLGRRVAALCIEAYLYPTTAVINKINDILNTFAGDSRYATNTVVTLKNEDSKREWLQGIAMMADTIWSTLGSSEKAAIGARLIALHDAVTIDDSSYMDGHGGGASVCRLAAMMVLYGESGFSSVPAKMQEDLDYWFGASSGANAAINMKRYSHADGGSFKGCWYNIIDGEYGVKLLHFMENFGTGWLLNGSAWDPYTDESWIDKLGEWFIRSLRGDLDVWNFGDTFRATNPWFADEWRMCCAALCERSATWTNQAKWLYNTLHAKSVATNGNPGYYSETYSFILNPSRHLATATSPAATTPALNRSRLFSPPGSYWYHNTWDITGPNNCIINIQCPDYYYQGHQGLECGAIQVNVRSETMLQSRGMYHTQPSKGTQDYGGIHRTAYAHLCISKSGVPHIDWRAAPAGPTNAGEGSIASQTPHSTKNVGGQWDPLPDGQGGQLYRRYGSIGDPDDANIMTSAGSARAWRRTRGFNGDQDTGMLLKESTSEFDHLSVDLRPAYLRQYSDLGGGSDRSTGVKMRYVIAKDAWQWPIIFYVCQITGTNSSYRKFVPFNFHADPTFPNVNDGGGVPRKVIEAKGSFQSVQGGAIVGSGNSGAIRIYTLDPQNYTFSSPLGGGPLDLSSWGSAQFTYNSYTSGGSPTSYNAAPTAVGGQVSDRNKGDIGRQRVEVALTAASATANFVFAIVPYGFSETPPVITLFEDADYYQMRVETTSPSKTSLYKVHKTLDQVVGPSEPAVENPPSPPTNLSTADGVVSGRVSLSGDLNTETSMSPDGYYKGFYRVKV